MSDAPPGNFDFLAGGGEAGRLMRDRDWSDTSLGPPTHWPQSLKTTVRIMLDSRYAMWLGWGPEFVFFCNEAYLPTLGVKRAWAMGASARKVWEEIWGDIGPRAERVIRGGGATWDEGLLLFLERRGFPEETYHTFSYSPVPDDRGGVGGMLCVVTEDTERVIGERRLRTLRELSAATAPAKAAVEACSLAAGALAANPRDLPFVLIYLVADDGRSARLAAATGLKPGDPAAPDSVSLDVSNPVPGWPFAAVFLAGRAADVTDLAAHFGPLHCGPCPEPVGTAVVLPVTQPGEDERPTGFFVAGVSPRRPLDEAYRSFLHLLSGHVTSAVSDARAYERERQRAESLAELDRAKTAFFSNVSHEFRTPLTLMLGPVEDLLARPDDAAAPDDRARLQVVHRNGLRLQKLVNTLLDFSRIEAGRVRAHFQPTDLAAATADLAGHFRSACERAGLSLDVDCPPLGEPVFVDREMWEKVVLNLVSNAFKSTLTGGIRVALRRADGAAELAVSDTGVGIPADHLPHLFERFYRVEGAGGRTREGSGIGLALVRELIQLHGGSVRAESVVGRGSEFRVRIPLGRSHLPAERVGAAPAPEPTAAAAAPFVEEALRWIPEVAGSGQWAVDRKSGSQFASPSSLFTDHSSPPTAPPRILLADDNADMRDYVRRLLAERYDVEAVTAGDAALAAARRRPPDLVVSDVMMPGLDGFGLLRELRADPATADVPVLLLSARAGEEARLEGLAAGADDYLTKPFGSRELLARVAAHLNLARLRRESRGALRESEARFRALADSAPVMIWVSGPDGRCSYFNRPWLEFVGRPLEEEIRTRWTVNVHPEDHARCRLVYATNFNAHTPFEMDYRLRRHDGEWRWVLDRGRPRFAPDGSYLGFVGSCTDITDRKRVADAQRFLAEAGTVLSSSLDYEATLAAVARLVVPRLADWCSVHVTEPGGGLRQLAVAHADPSRVAWAEELGRRYPPDPAAPHGVPAVVRSGEAELVPDVTDEMLVRGARDADHLATLRDLGLRSVMIVPLPARGRTVGAITFVAAESGRRYGADDLNLAQDLARRAGLAVDNARLFRETEDALRQLSLLVEASGRLTSSLDPPAVRAAVLDLSRRLFAADAHAIWRVQPASGAWVIEDSAGLSEAYLREASRLPAGHAVPEEPLVAEDVRALPLLAERLDGYRAEGIAALLVVPLKTRGRFTGTLTFYYHAPRHFDEGMIRVATALANLAGAALDTAELYHREADSRRRAEEADRRKDDFLALLGHELRNPLAPIRNAVQILKIKGDDPAVVVRAREMIGRQSEQMARLVDELLDASRIARGKVRLAVEPLDLAALARTTAEDLRGGLEAARLTLAVVTPTEPVPVSADPARLAQVIGNLIHNSQKFTDPGGRITVTVALAGGEATLAVADTGVGVDPGTADALFEPFHQVGTDAARTKGGLGLGLAVVKGLVELHGGRVEVASDGPGRGATFTVRLPLVTSPLSVSAGGSGPGTFPTPGRRVLVVEDGKDTAESLRMLLELKGYDVTVAHTGPEGVDAARRVKPDAVVCDLGLPGLSGFEVAEILRADPATAGSVLLCVSGYSQAEDRRKAREAGFEELLAKPADPATLLGLLAKRLNR